MYKAPGNEQYVATPNTSQQPGLTLPLIRINLQVTTRFYIVMTAPTFSVTP